MNAELLLQHFDRISEAPDAVPRLRRFILDLAVRGKLVEQDPNDEPAAKLLKRIQTVKAQLVKGGELRKQDDFPGIREVEFPFVLPSSWLWSRIGALGKTQTGTTPPKGKPEYFGTSIPFIKPGDIYPNRVDYSNEGLSEIGINEAGRLAQTGSILMVCIGTIGKCQRIDRDCSFNQQINSLSPYSETNSNYLLDAFQSDFFQKSAWAASACTTIAILNKGKWEHLLLPLPPLAEQHRIVAKVDELMALCDQLQAERNKREARRDRLVAASLNRISTTTAEDAKDATLFHLNHLPRLTTRTEHIKQLRQTILNLAVRGRLVPQDPNDEPAVELLKRIKAEKSRLVKEGQIRQEKALPPISEEEMLCVLPLHWKWSRLRSLVFILGDGLHGTPTYDDGTEYYFINGNNLVDGKIVIKSNTKTVSYDELQKHKKPMTLNTVLVSINGTLGNVAFYNNEEVILGKSACFFDLSECIDKQFIKIVIESPYFIDYARQSATGATIMNLSLKAMNEFPVPLPPLAEQNRIVTKVTELMALCDQLEAQLVTTEADSRRLLEAVLRDALDTSALVS